MIFNNNYLLYSNDYDYISPQEIAFIKTENNKVTIRASTNKTTCQNNISNNINLTFIISSPFEDIIRVQTYHHLGEMSSSPSFDVNSNFVSLQTEETEETLTITSGNLSLEINKKQWIMRYLRNRQILTESQSNDISLIKKLPKNNICYYDNYDNSYIRQQLSLKADELLYGFGESFMPFVKNGQIIETCNLNIPVAEGAAKTIPFYLSNKGYGVFVNHPQKIRFDICAKNFSKTEFLTEGSYLDYYVINGPSIKDVLSRYNEITCNTLPCVPDMFNLSASLEFDDDEKSIINFIDKLSLNNISLTTINFNNTPNNTIGWSDFLSDDNESCSYFNLMNHIKSKGLNTCITINPCISQHSLFFKECMDKEYFVKAPNGNIFQFDLADTGMALIDFTNPDAYMWYQNKLELLLDMGADTFYSDFINIIPDNAIYYNSCSPKLAKALYSTLYNKCVQEITEKKSENRIVYSSDIDISTRKSQIHLIHNNCSSYEEMVKTIRSNISLSMSGFTFIANVLNIYEEGISTDILKRWIAFSLLSSPVVFNNKKSSFFNDNDLLDVISHFSQHRNKLIPYLHHIVADSSKTGIPYLRSMIMEFSDDKNCLYLDKQYMLGDNILIAPVINSKNTAKYYLPSGIWTNYFTGNEYKGGTWIQEEHSYFSMPIMIRENSVIVTNCVENNKIYNTYKQEFELRVYAIHNGTKINTNIYGLDKSIELSASVKRNNHNIFIAVNSPKAFKIRMINMQALNAINGFITIDGNDSIITPDFGTNIIEINF